MKNKTLLLISIFLITFSFTNAQYFEWVKQAGGTFSDTGLAIVADSIGNTYVTGSFYNTATFGSITLTTNDIFYPDIFIAKYDASGNVVWARNAGGGGVSQGLAIALDASGNTYVTGFFGGTATFDSISLTSAGQDDIFVAKYDISGNVVWARNAGGSNHDKGHGIAVDAYGNCYVTGSFRGTATFGSKSLTGSSPLNRDIFITKYDTNGNVVWVQKAGGSKDEVGEAIVVDASGNIYVTGSFQGTATFGSITLTSVKSTDSFIAWYDGDGNPVWVQQAGGTVGRSIAVDSDQNVYITGYFQTTATFDSISLTSDGDRDIFIAKYNSFGSVDWARRAGGSMDDEGMAVAIDVFGNAYITGYFQNIASFGNTILTSIGNQDIFIVKYDSDGNTVRAQQAGGSQFGHGYGIAADSFGNAYVTGNFYETTIFGNDTLTSAGDYDIFVTKIGGGCSAETVVNIVSPLIGVINSYQAINSIVASNLIDGANIKYFAGDFITMEPGFEVKKGSVFEAKIQSPCQ